MATAELHRAPLQVVRIADALDVSMEPGENRRVHERLKASDLHWLRSARIKYGADIRVLDISAGGMLVETRNEPAGVPGRWHAGRNLKSACA